MITIPETSHKSQEDPFDVVLWQLVKKPIVSIFGESNLHFSENNMVYFQSVLQMKPGKNGKKLFSSLWICSCPSSKYLETSGITPCDASFVYHVYPSPYSLVVGLRLAPPLNEVSRGCCSRKSMATSYPKVSMKMGSNG